MPRRAPGAAVGTRRGLRVPAASRTDRGAVTAETVAVLPILVALTLGLVWVLSLAATQVRVVDAARETARAVARAEPVPAAVGLGRRVAPDGATIRIHQDGSTVVVDVAAEVRGPGGLFAVLPQVSVSSRAVTALEGS